LVPGLDIDAVQQELREFASARNWEPALTPKNLAMALSVEVAELLELFQWLTPEQSMQVGEALPSHRVAEEMADVLIYLMQMADVLGVDLPSAVARKIAANARKYPVPHPGRA
jgi:NTP pyrophosphatase (non-canonical NTP hydrolase)